MGCSRDRGLKQLPHRSVQKGGLGTSPLLPALLIGHLNFDAALAALLWNTRTGLSQLKHGDGLAVGENPGVHTNSSALDIFAKDHDAK